MTATLVGAATAVALAAPASADPTTDNSFLSALTNAGIAFGLALTIGIVTALLIHARKLVREALDPLFATYYAIPVIAFYPLFVILFGLGDGPQIIIAFMLGVVAVIVNTLNGLDRVPRVLLKTARVARMSPSATALKVTLPFALPYILTGLRLGLAQAWRILVGVEMLAAVPWGLGWMIFGAREFLNTDVMLAGVVVIGVIGLALEKLVFQRLENYTVVRWGMMT